MEKKTFQKCMRQTGYASHNYVVDKTKWIS